MPDPVKVDLAVAFPGETVLVKLLDVWEKSRANMAADTRDGWDKLALAMGRGWHNWCIDHGWPGERV